MNKHGQIKDRLEGENVMVVSSSKGGMAILLAIICAFVIFSCRGGETEPVGAPKIPMNDEEPYPEVGEDITESEGSLVEEVPDLQFTAKTRMTYLIDGAIDETEEGFVAIAGSKTRYETPKSRGLDYSLVTIGRGDLNLIYVLIPERNSYFTFGNEAEDEKEGGTHDDNLSKGKAPSDYGSILGGPFSPSANEVSRTPLGSEEVLGYVCKKYKVKEEFLDGTITHYTQWRAVDLNSITIKTEYRLKMGSTHYVTRWELVEIKRGPVSSDIFEVPDGYVKVRDLSEALRGSAP